MLTTNRMTEGHRELETMDRNTAPDNQATDATVIGRGWLASLTKSADVTPIDRRPRNGRRAVSVVATSKMREMSMQLASNERHQAKGFLEALWCRRHCVAE